jgi:hypothetical protein
LPSQKRKQATQQQTKEYLSKHDVPGKKLQKVQYTSLGKWALKILEQKGVDNNISSSKGEAMLEKRIKGG